MGIVTKWHSVYTSSSEVHKLYSLLQLDVTAGGPESPRGHMQPSSTVDFGWFAAFWEHKNCLKSDVNCNPVGLISIPFDLRLFQKFWASLFKLLYLAKDQWRGFSTQNAHMSNIVNWIRLKMVYKFW